MEKETNITFRIARSKPKHLCCAYHCKKERSTKDRFCPKHSRRYQRDTNPLKYTYSTLKNNALRRGKPFSLTFGEFKVFCSETDYLRLRGKTGKSASIDRIDNSKGYEIGNLRILSLSENSYKRNHEDYAPF